LFWGIISPFFLFFKKMVMSISSLKKESIKEESKMLRYKDRDGKWAWKLKEEAVEEKEVKEKPKKKSKK